MGRQLTGLAPGTVRSRLWISVPQQFRGQLGIQVWLAMDEQRDPCVALWPASEFQIVSERMRHLGQSQDRSRMRLWASSVVGREVKDGRLQLTDYLVKLAVLPDEVLFVGAIDRLEIWGRSTWATHTQSEASVE